METVRAPTGNSLLRGYSQSLRLVRLLVSAYAYVSPTDLCFDHLILSVVMISGMRQGMEHSVHNKLQTDSYLVHLHLTIASTVRL